MTTKDPEKLRVVKEKYQILRENLKGTEFENLSKCILITGHHTLNGTVGYNVNKGYEIGLCLDGEPNEIFHVLIHELAHCTVDEYHHTEQYWENYKKLRDMCIRLNIYEQIPNETPFCGMHIQDK
jgi:hypothetical protein